MIAEAGSFGTDLPARAWGPLRDLAIAEVEADRYAGAIGGILRQARLAALTDLLVEERRTAAHPPASGAAPATDIRLACERLARAWIAGDRQAQAEVEVRLARLGLDVSVVDDSAHAGALPLLTALERMRANAQRVAARNRKVLEEMIRTETAAERQTSEAKS
jgi:hypothetical protein